MTTHQAEPQSLTDIAEVSEKTASVSSVKSSSRVDADKKLTKDIDHDLMNLLGKTDIYQGDSVTSFEELCSHMFNS